MSKEIKKPHTEKCNLTNDNSASTKGEVCICKQSLRGNREVEHTPTPWYVSVNKLGQASVLHDSPDEFTPTEWIVNITTKENAEFIVRAVNSHDALLRVAIYALNELEHPHPNPENRQLTINDLKEAIQQAEGR